VTTLHLVRHAKSSWKEAGAADHERPLSSRGERAATRMSALLAAEGMRPELVLCSTAERAKETLARLLPGLRSRPRVLFEAALYLASAGALLDRLREVEPEVGEVLLVGHNPGMADLAALLVGAGDPAERARMGRKFPTGAWAEIRFTAPWGEIVRGSGELRRFVAPKELE
jgi:phosphohistidine phosphatase